MAHDEWLLWMNLPRLLIRLANDTTLSGETNGGERYLGLVKQFSFVCDHRSNQTDTLFYLTTEHRFLGPKYRPASLIGELFQPGSKWRPFEICEEECTVSWTANNFLTQSRHTKLLQNYNISPSSNLFFRLIMRKLEMTLRECKNHHGKIRINKLIKAKNITKNT